VGREVGERGRRRDVDAPLAMISTFPLSKTPTHEYVVPKSIPIALFWIVDIVVWVSVGEVCLSWGGVVRGVGRGVKVWV
jgi:hypothetical protein